MSGDTSNGHLDRYVKAGWLKIGLSQSDLAEVLDAVLQPSAKQDGDTDQVGADRLTAIGQALDIPIDALRSRGPGSEQRAQTSTDQASTERPGAEQSGAVQSDAQQPAPSFVDLSLSVLELRLLRAFCQLQDHRTKRLLIHLAEQLVKRQTGRGGDVA